MNGVHTTIVPIATRNEWSTYNYCAFSPLQRKEYKEVLILWLLATNGVHTNIVPIAPCTNGVYTTIVQIAPCNEWSTKKFCFYSPLQQMEYIQLFVL